jgi:hypothetical protein
MITEELFQGNSGSGLENRNKTTVGDFFYCEKKYCKYKKGLGNAHPASVGKSLR